MVVFPCPAASVLLEGLGVAQMGPPSKSNHHPTGTLPPRLFMVMVYNVGAPQLMYTLASWFCVTRTLAMGGGPNTSSVSVMSPCEPPRGKLRWSVARSTVAVDPMGQTVGVTVNSAVFPALIVPLEGLAVAHPFAPLNRQITGTLLPWLSRVTVYGPGGVVAHVSLLS